MDWLMEIEERLKMTLISKIINLLFFGHQQENFNKL